MEQFDELLKAMAEKEEIIVPNGFDKRMQDVLDGLPSKAKKAGLGAVKTALIAAVACAVLMCTAFAASPELRGMLAQALGSFAPYSHGQEDNTCTMDGFEVKVLSTLSDGSTLRAYVQVRDLEGDRLSAEMKPFGAIRLFHENETDMDGKGKLSSYGVDRGRAVYDEETKTALLTFTAWAPSLVDFNTARLDLWHIYDFANDGPLTPDQIKLTIPLEVEAAPKRSLDPDTGLADAFGAESAELSPLGLTMTCLDKTAVSPELTLTLFTEPVRVHMADGTQLDYEQSSWGMPTSQATYYNEDGEYCWVYFWNFPEALELDQVEGISIGGKYFPVK